MLIIEETNNHVDNLYEKLKKTQNNLYLCSNQKIIQNDNMIDNINNMNNINNINNMNNMNTIYKLENKIVKNKIEKIQKIIQKIEINNINLFEMNVKYYSQYRKENKKKRKLINKEYIEASIHLKKLNNPKITNLNNRRLLNYKKLI